MVQVWSRNVFLFIASLLLWLGIAWLFQATRPHFGEGKVDFPGRLPEKFSHPFDQKKLPKTKFILTENVELPRWHPVIFAFYPRDALWKIEVNGHEISAPGLPLSVAHHEGRSINLTPWLHPGPNELELEMEVYWGEASLNLYVSPWDKINLLITALIALATGITGAWAFSLFQIKITASEAALLLGGFLFRYLYFLGTPDFIRAYDWWGHEACLNYVAQHLSLPDSGANWESYQPPLYYVLVGGLTKLFLVGGMAESQFIGIWQLVSLICSALTLLAGFWIGKLLYENDANSRLYLLAVLGAAPALVFNASRVSNDVLVNLLEFIWLGLLLQFWKHPAWSSWLGLSFILGLALLTKANALVLLPISLLCLFLVPGDGARKKIPQAMALLIIVVAISGWYYFARAFHENGLDTYVVGNVRQLNPLGHIDGVFTKSLVFNPWEVLRHPFVDPWGPRHEYFPEYFFKSIFLGEGLLGSTYRWIARAFILTALLLIPVLLRGVWSAARARTAFDVPLLVLLFAVFLAQWTFVQIAPYMSSQDFRYSTVLLFAFVYFFNQGLASLNDTWRQRASFGLQLLILNSAIYLLEVALEG